MRITFPSDEGVLTLILQQTDCIDARYLQRLSVHYSDLLYLALLMITLFVFCPLSLYVY